MKKWHFISAVCALLLAGCAHVTRPPDPVRPQVSVAGGRLVVVNAEPLTFYRRGEVTITWHLPKDSKYTFDINGIVIDGRLVRPPIKEPKDGSLHQTYVLDPKQDEIVNCSKSKDGSEFSCVNRNRKPGRYKYTIRVQAGNTLLELDPWIMNAEEGNP